MLPSFHVAESIRTSPTLLHKLKDPGNRASWEVFYARYQPLIAAVAEKAGLGEADVEDLVQETLIEVARQMPTFDYDGTKGTFKGWLLGIVRRRVATHWRSQSYKVGHQRAPKTEPLDEEAVDRQVQGGVEIEHIWDEEWRAHINQQALEEIRTKVKPLQFQIFKLHVLKEIPARTVARRLGVKLMQVYWARLRTGRIFLEAREAAERGE